MKQLKNKKMLALVVISAIVIAGVLWAVVGRGSLTSKGKDLIENEEVIPTVDSSVKVSLVSSAKRGEVEITIKNAPKGSTSADIEVSYNREPQATDEVEGAETIPDGALTSCQFKNGSRDCQVEGITLGTCSSGVCRYHKVIGKIKLTVLFKGTYGKKLFEKEYEL